MTIKAAPDRLSRRVGVFFRACRTFAPVVPEIGEWMKRVSQTKRRSLKDLVPCVVAAVMIAYVVILMVRVALDADATSRLLAALGGG